MEIGEVFEKPPAGLKRLHTSRVVYRSVPSSLLQHASVDEDVVPSMRGADARTLSGFSSEQESLDPQ